MQRAIPGSSDGSPAVFKHLNRAYRDAASMRDQRPFVDKALDRLRVKYEVTESDLQPSLLPTSNRTARGCRSC